MKKSELQVCIMQFWEKKVRIARCELAIAREKKVELQDKKLQLLWCF